MNAESVRRAMARKSDEELYEVVGPDRETYRPEAVEIAEQELESRGLDPFSPPAEDPVAVEDDFDGNEEEADADEGEYELVGVEGWLGLLASIMVFFSPIRILIVLTDGSAVSLFTLPADVYMIIAGLMIWREKQRAIHHAVAALGLAAFTGVSAAGVQMTSRSSLLELVIPLVGPGIWILYLFWSRRVRNTFPDWGGAGWEGEEDVA